MVVCNERLSRTEMRGTRSSWRPSTPIRSVGSTGPADQASRSPGLSRPATSSSSAIPGLPLLAECGDALGKMGASPNAIPKLLLEGLPARGIIGNSGADLRLHRLHGGGAVGCDRSRSLNGRSQDVAGRQHAVDQTDAGRKLCRYQTAGEQQIHGMNVADLL